MKFYFKLGKITNEFHKILKMVYSEMSVRPIQIVDYESLEKESSNTPEKIAEIEENIRANR